MKKKLLSLIFLLASIMGNAQTPQITGDTVLCPNSNGTAVVTGSQTYDTYTWYWKYWFTSDEFQVVAGVSEPTFTYDWYTYDQALIKVVVTLNGNTYESNTIQIDSYNWLPIYTGFEDSDNITVAPDSGNVHLCAGTSFELQVFDPFNTNIRWYRDGQFISGANTMILQVTEAGTYYVIALPGICPDNVSSTQGTPTVVVIDDNCNLEIEDPAQLTEVAFYPNPVSTAMHLHLTQPSAISIFNVAGQKVFSGITHNIQHQIDVSMLESGCYYMMVESGFERRSVKFIKK